MKSLRFYGNCRNKTPTSMSRILNLAEENALPFRSKNDQFSVTVLPPTNATDYITDENSGDEDGAGTINNLPGSMLLARALIDDSSCKNVKNIEEQEGPPNKRKKQTDKPKRDWVKPDLKSELPEWTSENDKVEDLRNKNLTPKGYFELLFGDEVLNLIVDETNWYAFQKTRNLSVDRPEITCFIGILFSSGYLAPPRRRLYWKNASDTHHDLITNAMRRDKFEAIFTNFHLADNNCLDE